MYVCMYVYVCIPLLKDGIMLKKCSLLQFK